MRTMAAKLPEMPSLRKIAATIPEVFNPVPEWGSREAEEEDIYGPRIPRFVYERIEYEDQTLMAGVPTEEVLASIARGWAWPEIVPITQAYQARKHAPWLLESEPLRIE